MATLEQATSSFGICAHLTSAPINPTDRAEQRVVSSFALIHLILQCSRRLVF